jgi:1-acyl-sn-glycerol-3-phosphate acyltransferase
VFRFLGCFGIFGTFILEAVIMDLSCLVLGTVASVRVEMKAELVSRYSARMLRLLGISLLVRNFDHRRLKGLLICNHLSYVDVLVLACVAPSTFVTSVEVKNSFGLGLITRLAGCVFVERRNRANISSDSDQIRVVLESGGAVVLFPEGTSTDGAMVLPFRPAFFQSAIDARSEIHDFYLNYNHRSVAYHGSIGFVPHLWNLCRQKNILATLTYLGDTRIQSDSNRKCIAQASHARVLGEHVSRIQ